MISTAGEVGPCSAWPEQVGGDKLGIGVGVRDHDDLGRAGEQVDADRAEQLALGLGDVGVAGADDHVGGLEALDPECHRRQRLHAAEARMCRRRRCPSRTASPDGSRRPGAAARRR